MVRLEDGLSEPPEEGVPNPAEDEAFEGNPELADIVGEALGPPELVLEFAMPEDEVDVKVGALEGVLEFAVLENREAKKLEE